MTKKSIIFVLTFLTFSFSMAQKKVKIVIQNVDGTMLFEDTIPETASVSFRTYYEPLPDGLKDIDMGFGLHWASGNYRKDSINLFLWPKSNLLQNWKELYGSDWRVPTIDDFRLLKDSCTCTYKKVGNEVGFEFYSPKTGNTIFLPFDGKNKGDKFGIVGYYWTSDYEDGKGGYFQMSYDSALEDKRFFTKFADTEDMMSIRPVYGQRINPVKVSFSEVKSDSYHSAVVSIDAENVQFADITSCGVYYSLDPSALPTSEKPSTTLTPIEAKVAAAAIEKVVLNDLTSGATYYVCSYVTAGGVTTYSETIEVKIQNPSAELSLSTSGSNSAIVTLALKASPLSLIDSCVVEAKADTVLHFPVKEISSESIDIELSGLDASTNYSCTAILYFNKTSYRADNPLTFITKKKVNEKYPIPDAPVDLGLPSGTKWSPYNFGEADANSIEGHYFGWGDPTGEVWEKNDGKYAQSAIDKEGKPLTDIAGTEYDIAHVQWEDEWRLPRISDFEELYSNCTFNAASRGGVKGYMVKNKKGVPNDSIFIPMTGSWNFNSTPHAAEKVDTSAFYWTSEAPNLRQGYRYHVTVSDAETNSGSFNRWQHFAIRPVYGGGHTSPASDLNPLAVKGYDEGKNTAIPETGVDFGLPSGVLWAAWNVGVMEYGETGKYYAWGEIADKTVYEEDTYSSPAKGRRMYDPLPDTLDVARMLWKDEWRMPTTQDFDELLATLPNEAGNEETRYVTLAWEYDEAHKCFGYRITGKGKYSANSIFLPAAGYKTTSVTSNDYGYYWTSNGSSNNGSETTDANYFLFKENGNPETTVQKRFLGMCVRPVYGTPKSGSRPVRIRSLLNYSSEQ